MFIIQTSATCKKEKNYIFNQIFSLFLGLPFQVEYTGESGSINILKEHEAGKLVVNDTFFAQFENKADWLSKGSMPLLPLKSLKSKALPIIYGNDQFHINNGICHIGLDLFGSSFFMLTRYEELVIKERDFHGRFPAKESIAYKEGFLTRPIVDEYVNFLWDCILALWPNTTKKDGPFCINLSCDVDNLYDKGIRFPGILKRLGGDLIKRTSILQFLTSLKLFFKVSVIKQKKYDPFNTFDFMMDVCEANGIKMAFYFIPRNNKTPIDGDYDIESSEIIELMKNIIERGHEVGYHASYYSYMDEEKTKEEVRLLKNVYKRAGGCPEDIKGGRQHYLRWEPGITEKNWESAGLSYDTTLGFAEHAGFRCGTSKEYSLYNLRDRRVLNLKEKPLIVMEGSLFLDKYQNLKFDEAAILAQDLKRKCQQNENDFNVLWHNSFFREPRLFNFFKKICKV